ncbi:DUF2637 domain-containing protein [Streptomyces roseirectus]|uniref:DUF2637 domain-containing protein n=1 Tax=Streptomyces roseirectus TaxID=2768066 RepID=UPI001FE3A843|nr:DUF2637 domain-containing protein [Streptomyces roseirectus]
MVASVAAYASYLHQRAFAQHGGADATSAVLWPLSVGGLLLLATVGLLHPARQTRRERTVVWTAFLLGIAVSLAANIAAALTLAWQPVLVADWPPVALLLSVELLTHRDRHQDPTAARQRPRDQRSTRERPRRHPAPASRPPGPHGAEQIMWEHHQHGHAAGRTPTGTDLDRVAGTNNYGRAVLRRWRRIGRIPTPPKPFKNPQSQSGPGSGTG